MAQWMALVKYDSSVPSLLPKASCLERSNGAHLDANAERAARLPRMSFASGDCRFAWDSQRNCVSLPTAATPPVTRGIIDSAAVRTEWGGFKRYGVKGGEEDAFSWWKAHEATISSPM
jgi:hypothetical protein